MTSSKTSTLTSPFNTQTSSSAPICSTSDARLENASPINASARAVANSPMLDAFSASSVLNPGFGIDKQPLYYSHLESTIRRPSTPPLLSALPKDTRDYLLHASSYLSDPSQQSLFHTPHFPQMSSSYADSNIISNGALSPSLLGSDRMAAVSSLRACTNTYPNASPSLSTHYETPYRSFGRRIHEMQGQTWKSMYAGQTTGHELEPETVTQSLYLNPPPAHHNTTAGRYLSPSSSYTVPTPLVTSSQYLLSSLSGGTAPSVSATSTDSTGLSTSRKYNRRSITTNRPPPAVKETEEYKVKRHRNNLAVRKSREKSKRRLKENENRAQDLIVDNQQLRNRINVLSKMMGILRMLLYTSGVSQDKINIEISRSVEGTEPSGFNSSTHGFAHPSMTGHEF